MNYTDPESRRDMRRLMREIENNADAGLGATHAELVFLLDRIANQQEEIARLYRSDEVAQIAIERRPHRIGGRRA